MALAEAQLGKWEKAQENLVKALDYKTDIKLNLIDKALQSTLVSKHVDPFTKHADVTYSVQELNIINIVDIIYSQQK